MRGFPLGHGQIYLNMDLSIGTAFRTGNVYYASPDSGDIWDISDYFGYLWRNGGNVSVEGNVYFPSGALAWNAKAGIMYRESVAANSAFIAIVKLYDGILAILSRETTGTNVNLLTTKTGAGSINKLKLDNSNNVQKMYFYNGNAWELLYTTTQPFTSSAKIGFCFALVGGLGICSMENVIYKNSDIPVSTKPANLTGGISYIKSATTEQPSGQTNNKPLNLIGGINYIKSTGTPSTSTGTTPTQSGAKAATSGFNVFSFGNKEGLFYSQSQAKTQQMKLVADVGANTISDEAWNYNPPMWNNATNSMVTPYKAWKINDTGDWKTTALTNIDVSHYDSKPITVTKIFYFVDVYTKVKMFQQQIQVF